MSQRISSGVVHEVPADLKKCMVRRGASRRIFEGAEVVCKNVFGLLVEQAPGHDEDSRVPVLISTTGPHEATFFVRFQARR